MRAVEFAQIIGTLVAAFASVITGVEQRLFKRLERADASTAENAIHIESKFSVVRWRLSRLVSRGAVHTTDDGRFYHDHEAHRRLRLRRLTIAIPVVLIAIALVFALHWLFE